MIIDYEKLRYRNQFVLGPAYIKRLEDWQRIKVNPAMHLTAHPDLNIYQAAHENKSLTLIGFILDPENPQNSDADIVNALILKLSEADEFFPHTDTYGGRWVLIVNDGKQTTLFTDAVGLRQVFYSNAVRTDHLWCASQPGMIADRLGLEMEPEGVEFIDSYEFRKNPEFRWPADSSPYRDIKHLLPNHFLDLHTGQCKRYWPHAPLPDLSLDEGISRTSATLRGLMKSAANRFDLSLSLTAGLDSRVVLAASKEIKDTASYMTVRQIRMPDDYADITVPSALLSKLGLKHDVVKSSLVIDDEFIEMFKKNVPIPHYVYAPDAHAILKYYAQKKVAVTGGTSEVSRSSFRGLLGKPAGEQVTLQDFARLQEMGNDTYTRDHYQTWISGLGNTYNLDILNLFEWELDDGNWLAMCQLEFDIAWKDIFTPFNCKALIRTMLSLKQDLMMPPKYEFYYALISDLWPEVLNVPVNPHKKRRNFSSKLKSYVRSRLLPLIR